MPYPDSRNGAVKSTAASLSALTLSEVSAMSKRFSTTASISPFHLPSRPSTPHFGSATRVSSNSNWRSSANLVSRSMLWIQNKILFSAPLLLF